MIRYRAEFHDCSCRRCCSLPQCISICYCGPCCTSARRDYFMVLENAYEQNTPIQTCCFGVDVITKYYFDRGIYDQQNLMWLTGYFSGAPSTHPGPVKYICCFTPCSDSMNECLECYSSSLCGDRVRVVPSEFYCWCCSTRATDMTNYCGLCGPMTGQPLMLFSFIDCLKVGTADEFVQKLETARLNWKNRTGKN